MRDKSNSIAQTCLFLNTMLFFFSSAAQWPSSKSWTLSLSTFPRRSSSATCQVKLRHGSAAQTASGPTPVRESALLPPTPSWSSSTTTWSCCQASAAGRRPWWRLLRASRLTSCPGLKVCSRKCKTSWRNIPWRLWPPKFLPSMPAIQTRTCRHPSNPRCSPGKGVHQNKKTIYLWYTVLAQTSS